MLDSKGWLFYCRVVTRFNRDAPSFIQTILAPCVHKRHQHSMNKLYIHYLLQRYKLNRQFSQTISTIYLNEMFRDNRKLYLGRVWHKLCHHHSILVPEMVKFSSRNGQFQFQKWSILVPRMVNFSSRNGQFQFQKWSILVPGMVNFSSMNGQFQFQEWSILVPGMVNFSSRNGQFQFKERSILVPGMVNFSSRNGQFQFQEWFQQCQHEFAGRNFFLAV